MRNNSMLDETSKSKGDQQVALISSFKEVCRVVDTNQQRLQQLELAVANLTTICSAIRQDMYSLSSSSNQKLQPQVVEMKRPSYMQSGLDLKNDAMGVQMQELVKQAAALGILKDSQTSPINLSAGNVKANSEIPTKPVPRKVQITTNPKSSAKQLVQRMESTTEKKMSAKLTTVKNNMGATQPKAAKGPAESRAENNLKATETARVSLKSTVKRTETTISKVYVDQPTRNKGMESAAKNVENIQGKSSIKIKAHQGQSKSSNTAPKSNAPTKGNSLPGAGAGAVESGLKPRRKWGDPEEITLK